MLPPAFLHGFQLNRVSVPSFKEYPFSIPAIRKMKRVKLHPAVTFFIGENGSGKSTLVEALAVANRFNPEGGSRNFEFSTRASHSSLSDHLTLDKSLRRATDGFFPSGRKVFSTSRPKSKKLDSQGEGKKIGPSYGDRPLHEQSHGESFFAPDGPSAFRRRPLHLRRARGRALAHAANEHARADEGGWSITVRNSSSPRIRPSSWPIPTR